MMKFISTIVLLITMGAPPSIAQSKRKKFSIKTSKAELIELERQLSEALSKQDAPVLDRLWADTLVFTFPDGKVSNKAERLAAQKPSADPTQFTSRNEDVKVQLYGNSAVVTVRTRWEGKAAAQSFSTLFQATHVWLKQSGRWQLVAAHVSQVKP